MRNSALSNAAAILGRKGGSKKSKTKSASSARNGKKGGRPPKIGITDWSYFMDALDEARRNNNPDAFFPLYTKSRITKERALIQATVRHLCTHEFHTPPPSWARETLWLKEPWFIADVENLKALALVESPAEFRASHIFVLSNFLKRV